MRGGRGDVLVEERKLVGEDEEYETKGGGM